MENISITKMSSKGQIVIPQDIRVGINEGDKLIVLKNKDQIIIKKADKSDKNFEEDFEFAKKTEEAWNDIKKGKFKKMSVDNFLKEIRSFK